MEDVPTELARGSKRFTNNRNQLRFLHLTVVYKGLQRPHLQRRYTYYYLYYFFKALSNTI